MLLIKLYPEDPKNTLDVDDSTSDNYIRHEMPFNRLMTEFFQGSDINDLIQHMLAHIKTHKLKILECLTVVIHWIK